MRLCAGPCDAINCVVPMPTLCAAVSAHARHYGHAVPTLALRPPYRTTRKMVIRPFMLVPVIIWSGTKVGTEPF